ncbi:hypothetical protein IAR55_005697 [Kwoniella newhampshirensis]|uniref:Uncharacterized protein n=1 Tax=Kwoniella newhampshirensis TaxID=1651941 RepID=A0AAW0YUS0_9TREE
MNDRDRSSTSDLMPQTNPNSNGRFTKIELGTTKPGSCTAARYRLSVGLRIVYIDDRTGAAVSPEDLPECEVIFHGDSQSTKGFQLPHYMRNFGPSTATATATATGTGTRSSGQHVAGAGTQSHFPSDMCSRERDNDGAGPTNRLGVTYSENGALKPFDRVLQSEVVAAHDMRSPSGNYWSYPVQNATRYLQDAEHADGTLDDSRSASSSRMSNS